MPVVFCCSIFFSFLLSFAFLLLKSNYDYFYKGANLNVSAPRRKEIDVGSGGKSFSLNNIKHLFHFISTARLRELEAKAQNSMLSVLRILSGHLN